MNQEEDQDINQSNANENQNANENASNPPGENADEDDELFEHLPADHPHLRPFVFFLKKKVKIQKN